MACEITKADVSETAMLLLSGDGPTALALLTTERASVSTDVIYHNKDSQEVLTITNISVLKNQ